MTPPNRPKRPSARPSARPPAKSPSVPPKEDAAAPKARRAAAEAKATGVAKGKKDKPRVAARRPSVAPKAAPDRAPVAEESAPPIEEAPQSQPEDLAQAHAVPDSTRAPASTSNGLADAHAPESTVAEAFKANGSEVLPGEEDDDIWSDTAPDPELVQRSQVLSRAGQAGAGERVSASLRPASRLARGTSASEPRGQAALIGSSQSLLSTDYYFRQYGAHGMRNLSAEVDEFGLDPHVEQTARPVLEALCKRYFRVSVEGAANLPASGRALMVANRSGAVPWDGLVLRTALRMERPDLPPVRWLSEDSVIHYPFLGVFMNRLGAVRACPENAERLLSQDKLVVAFPEGAQGSSKLFKERYRLQRFGRGGYVKLALKLEAPIIPTAIIGAEETNPLLSRSRLLGKPVGADYLAITPTFPWLGPLGLLPVPIKWHIAVGEPIDLSGYGPASADDALVVHRLNEQIRGILQGLVDRARAARGSVLFG